MAGELILLVDDEANILQLSRIYLEREGYKVQAVENGLDALKSVANDRPDLIVLDVMLPGVDGFEICRRVRTTDALLPIIMLTARDEDIDKILGLELGADDYMTKPFNPRELVARVKAILRRISTHSPEVGGTIRVKDVEIDPSRREVRINGQVITLRTQEFEVLLTLAQHLGQVLTREQLLKIAWGFDFAGQTRTVDMHVAQIRRRLTGCAIHIETITGIGYKLVA
ncbi:MAG TPA: response regulator transcription factor [Longilinea sp.]|nr:response regulator transcription factor [Longilinea sp.]